MINYYEILGISSNASIQEIKVAIAEKTFEDGKESQDVYKAIYELLTNPTHKKAYDERLRHSIKQEYTIIEEYNRPQLVYGPPPASEMWEVNKDGTSKRIR